MPDILDPPVATPDFDHYLTERRVITASVTRDGRAVHLGWDDALTAEFHVYALRENATEADMMHPVTREQRIQLVELPDDLTIKAVDCDPAGGLNVQWSTGGKSRFHPGWLRAYAEDAADDPSRLPERTLWDAGLREAVPRFDGRMVLADAATGDAYAAALWTYGLAVVADLPAKPDMVEALAEVIGPVRATNFGRVFDVRSDLAAVDTTSNAYTAMALPVHTDLCTREYKPGLQYLLCMENRADGGDSLLVDGFAIADHLRRQEPDTFEALSQIPFSYYNKAIETDFRWQSPVFRLDDNGSVVEVRWSPWLRAPQRASFETVERAYTALRRAFRLAEDPAFTLRVRLSPGEALCFDNRRILHGRTMFNPATGGRWLRGCYGEREDLCSRLRIAARRRRAATQPVAG